MSSANDRVVVIGQIRIAKRAHVYSSWASINLDSEHQSVVLALCGQDRMPNGCLIWDSNRVMSIVGFQRAVAHGEKVYGTTYLNRLIFCDGCGICSTANDPDIYAWNCLSTVDERLECARTSPRFPSSEIVSCGKWCAKQAARKISAIKKEIKDKRRNTGREAMFRDAKQISREIFGWGNGKSLITPNAIAGRLAQHYHLDQADIPDSVIQFYLAKRMLDKAITNHSAPTKKRTNENQINARGSRNAGRAHRPTEAQQQSNT